jgi:hypothetical protein
VGVEGVYHLEEDVEAYAQQALQPDPQLQVELMRPG